MGNGKSLGDNLLTQGKNTFTKTGRKTLTPQKFSDVFITSHRIAHLLSPIAPRHPPKSISFPHCRASRRGT